MNKQKTILYILIGVLILAVIYAYFQFPRQSRMTDPAIAAKSKVRRSVRSKKGAAKENQFRIRFDWLKNEKPFKGAEEDLFGPLYGAGKGRSLAVAQKKPTLPPISQGAGARVISSPPLEFLGFLASGRTRSFFFALGEDVFVAKKGEKFGKQKEFRIVGATEKELKVKKQGDTELLTISLVAKNILSGFNKQKAENTQQDIAAKRKDSSPEISVPVSQPPPESAKKADEVQPQEEEEFRPEGDWEK